MIIKYKKKSLFFYSSLIIFLFTLSFFLIEYENWQANASTYVYPNESTSYNNTVQWSHPLNENENGRIYLDENGVALYDVQYIDEEYVGKQRNSVIIYRVANVFYKDFQENGNTTSKKFFMNSVDWLLENTIKHENYSIFEYPYRHSGYELPSGWRDSLGQARIINLMIKAHQLTNDEKYLAEAKLLSNAFFVKVSDGGLTYKTKNKGWWYEHFAHEVGLHPRVLNGMLFTLVDLHSMYKYTNDPQVKFLFDQGIIALKNDLPIYDFFGYTYYDSLERSSGYHYQKINVQKSEVLYDITQESFLLEYHNKWKSCTEPCHFIFKHIGLFLREAGEIFRWN